MIRIYKNLEGQLQELQHPEVGCWINITGSDPTDREWIEQNLGEISESLIDFQDVDEMSRVEKEDDYLTIILRIPHFSGVDSDKPFVTIPLVIILTDELIITACTEESVIISEFVKGRVKGAATVKRNRFLLLLLWKTANRYLLHLRNINKIVEELEDELENSLQNKEIMALLKYEKALIYYTTALKSNEAMMERLKRMLIFRAYEEDMELLEDVLIENLQAIEMTNISQNILAQMTEAYSSIINNNMNNVIKFLTLVTICISLPTLISSFYGMNISLPGQDSEKAFFVIIAFSVGMVLATILFFRKKRWF